MSDQEQIWDFWDFSDIDWSIIDEVITKEQALVKLKRHIEWWHENEMGGNIQDAEELWMLIYACLALEKEVKGNA